MVVADDGVDGSRHLESMTSRLVSSVSSVVVDRLARGKFGCRRTAADSRLSETRIWIN